jgi:hypothetical protein
LITSRELRNIFVYHSGMAKYMFVHIPKNAGVSVRKSPALHNRLISADPYFHKSKKYTRQLTRVMRESGEHHGYQHARWRDIHPSVTERLTSVAIVRNPWARTVSRFRFVQTAMQQGTAKHGYSSTDFEEFLEERHTYGGRDFFWHRAIRGWYPQADYVLDERGNLKVDVLRFEKMEDEILSYFQADLRKHKNKSADWQDDYRHLYTAKTKKIVGDWYAKDVELFGFDFESSATTSTFVAQSVGKPNVGVA